MSKASYLTAEFSTPENTRFGVLALRASDASAMVQRAKEEGLRVLGIDSLLVQGTTAEPLFVHSIDYSARGHFADSDWDEALAFIEKKAPLGVLFDVVLGDALALKKEPNKSMQRTPPSRGR